MQNIKALIKKELQSYFYSPIAYIFIAVYLSITAWLFFVDFFLIGELSMQKYFSLIPWVFLFIIPAATMRLWSEEIKEGTAELLLTWPTKSWHLVLGKFIASLIFIGITLILSMGVPLSLSFIGPLDWGVVAAAYISALFLAAIFLAVGGFISSLTENQIIAFIGAVAACFILFIIGNPVITLFVPHFLTPLLSYIGAATHYQSIARGVLDTRDIIYVASVLLICIYITSVRITNKRW